jgi:hypothetical protein
MCHASPSQFGNELQILAISVAQIANSAADANGPGTILYDARIGKDRAFRPNYRNRRLMLSA